MNGNQLKALIDKLDPTGEIEIAIGNQDIYFGEVQPAYWDGRLERLIIDESKRGKCYSVIGAKVIGSGQKLTLHTMGVSDVLMGDADAHIDLSNLEKNMPSSYNTWKQQVEDWRKSFKAIEEQIRKEK